MKTVRLKQMAEVIPGQSPPSAAVHPLISGLPFIQGNAEFTDVAPRPIMQCDAPPKVARGGDLLVSVRAPVGALNWASGRLGIGRGVAAIRVNSNVDARFVRYGLVSQLTTLQSVSTGTTYLAVSAEQVSNLRIPTMSLGAQRRIADFLDDRVSRIDNIISARRQQLTALRARIRSIVNSVTSVAFLDNYGTRLKLLYDVIDERAGEHELQLLSVSIHQGVVPRSTMTPDEARAEDLSNYKVSRPGDIVLNRMRAFQGAIGVNRVLGIVSPDYLVLRPRSMVRADWLHYVFRSSWFVGEMIARLRGIGSVELGSVRTPRINASDLGEIRLLIPDLHEQGVAVDRLAAVQESTESAVDALERSITLLTEYKQSLITSAVTGELDVTTASRAIPA